MKEIKKNLIKYNTEHNLTYLKEQGYVLFYNYHDKHTKLLCNCFFIHPEAPGLYFLFQINAPSYGLVSNHHHQMNSRHSHIVEPFKKFLRANNRKKVVGDLLNNQKSILTMIE
jgi:hypothetical protein